MALAELQAALARIYTDEQFRQEFAASPGSVGSQIGLSDSEINHLANLILRDNRITDFARSLISKRRNEVAKMLPMTRTLLGDQFIGLFDQFAGSHPFDKDRRHLGDALAFGKFASTQISNDSARKSELIRYETDCLEAHAFHRFLQYKLYRYPVDSATPDNIETATGRNTIVIWLRRPWGDRRLLITVLHGFATGRKSLV